MSGPTSGFWNGEYDVGYGDNDFICFHCMMEFGADGKITGTEGNCYGDRPVGRFIISGTWYRNKNVAFIMTFENGRRTRFTGQLNRAGNKINGYHEGNLKFKFELTGQPI